MTARDKDGNFLFQCASGGPLTLRVDALHYYEADGLPREFRVALDVESSTVASEIKRTLPSPTFEQRQAAWPKPRTESQGP